MNKTTVFFLLLCILSSFFNQNAQAQCHKDDWEALSTLYNSTNGDNWTNQTGWDMYIANQLIPPNSCDLSALYGIKLDDNGRVTCIDMDGKEDCFYSYNDGNNLDGILPSELGKLSHLTYLNLKDNQLSGSLPAELGNLTNLRQLLLNNNQLSGSLPAELGNLTNLVWLFLSYNQFNSSVISELGNLTNLEILVLDNNQLSGNLPVELGNLTKLRELFLYNNKLNGSLPIELSNLTNLEILRLDSNRISGNLPAELGKLTNLRELFLNNNQFSGSLPAELGNLTNLVWLFLSYNQFNSSVISALGNLTNLEILVLDNNQLSGNLPAELGKLTKLRELFLYNNELNGSLPVEIGNLTNLEILRLDNNRLSGNLPAELGNLINLNWLFLSNNQLNGSLPADLSNLTNLEVLRLENNRLSEDLPAQLGKLTNLRELFLNNNQFSGNLPTELGDLTNLVWLFLSYNQFDGSLPAELCHLTNLTILSIRENNLQGCYPACMNSFCVQLNDPYFYGSYDVSDGNNFDATWEDFCGTEDGICICNPNVIDNVITLPTNYSKEVKVEVTLNDEGQYILKNEVATVYDYGTCKDYNNLEDCQPVTVCDNNLTANEALWAVTKAAEFFSTYLNAEIPMVNIVVNNTEEINYSKYYSTNRVIVLGKGDGKERKSMSAPDIVGHEYAHAIINVINDLGHYKISGALNESYADIIGELVEYICYEKKNSSWVFGKQVMIDSVVNKAGIRNLSYPKDTTMKYQMPDTYEGENWLEIDDVCFHKDRCGVHTNCGVHSYWFYLLAFGGSGINENGYEFDITEGVGIEKAIEILFHNLKYYLTPQSTYNEVREGTICSAEELFEDEPNVLETTIEAWNAVGVYEVIDNPIEFRITNAIQTDEETESEENGQRIIPVQFDLNIDSLGQDISADGLCFTLHKPNTYVQMYIETAYAPLTNDLITTEEIDGAISICINRLNNEINKKERKYPLIPSNSSIFRFKGCIVSDDVGGDELGIAPIGVSGFTKVESNEKVNFKSATLPFSFDYNDGGSDSAYTLNISLKLNHKNCNNLGAIQIEVLDEIVAGTPPYTYTLKNSIDTILLDEVYDSVYHFYSLEKGNYEVNVKDNENQIGNKKFSIDFVGEQTGSNCCAENLIIPPGSVNGYFNSIDTISFSNGTLIEEGVFEICNED